MSVGLLITRPHLEGPERRGSHAPFLGHSLTPGDSKSASLREKCLMSPWSDRVGRLVWHVYVQNDGRLAHPISHRSYWCKRKPTMSWSLPCRANLLEKERKPGGQPDQDEAENRVRMEVSSQQRQLMGTPLCPKPPRSPLKGAGQDGLRPRCGVPWISPWELRSVPERGSRGRKGEREF